MSGTVTIQIPYNWRPRPYQMKGWAYLEHGGRHAEWVWHRRAGKDEMSLHWTAVSCFKRPANYWHMLPQANQARKAIWMAVNPHTGKRRIDEAFPPEIRASMSDHEMSITMRSGAVWQVVGSDNFNSLLGSPPAGLVFSEWPLCDPAAYAYLMPILEENKGWAIFNGTPRGKNHAYRSVMEAKKNPDKFGQILRAQDTGVFRPEQLAAIKRSLLATYGEEFGLSVYEQEYECSFEAANLGAILGRGMARAESEGRIDDAHDYDPAGAPVVIFSDIGRRDASSWWFCQPTVGGFRMVDFDKDSGLDADEWCERLKKRMEDNVYKLGLILLPHDAKAKTFAAKHSAIEVFISHFGTRQMRVGPNVDREDRINAARRFVRRCSFHRTKTEKGRDGLSAWSYIYDEERREFSKEPDHNWASHDGDAFSYGAIYIEEAEPSVEEQERPVRGAVMPGPYGGFVTTETFDEMWAANARQTRQHTRI